MLPSASFQSVLVLLALRSFCVFFVEFVAVFDSRQHSLLHRLHRNPGAALWEPSGQCPEHRDRGDDWRHHGPRGMLLAFSATSLTHLYLGTRLLPGAGWAWPSLHTGLLSHYFSAHQSLALGLALTGVSLSCFASAPLFQWLLSHCAWQGGPLLLVSALSLHLVACGALIPLSGAEDPA